MAYSRWTRSRFYTYWMYPQSADADDSANSQALMIDDGTFITVSYGELALENGVERFLDRYHAKRGLTYNERTELRGYLEAFMLDIQEWKAQLEGHA